VLMIRKVKRTLRESVFALVSDVISEFDLTAYAKKNKSDMSFELGNSEIITSGLDDPEKIKSIHNITMIWVEEATELDEIDFDQLDLRMRGIGTKKQIIASFNPISEDHWIKRKFFEEKVDDVFILRTTYKDNFYLDEDYSMVLEQRMSFDDNLKRIYVDGEWGRITTGSEFYCKFSYKDHAKEIKYDISNPVIHVAFDFNVNPYMPASIWQISSEYIEQNGKKIKIYNADCIDEVALKNPRNKTSEVCKEIIDKYGHSIKTIYYYGDASGRVRSTQSNQHNYEIIEKIFRPFLHNSSERVPRANPSIRKRRDFVNALLSNVFPVRLRFAKSCKLTIMDLENVLEAADGTKHVPMAKDPISRIVFQKYGHFSDACDYFLVQAFKVYYDDLYRYIGKE